MKLEFFVGSAYPKRDCSPPRESSTRETDRELFCVVTHSCIDTIEFNRRNQSLYWQGYKKEVSAQTDGRANF